MSTNSGTLYVVATPIGNLADLSARAATTLAEVELILAEDTRMAARLLAHYGIRSSVKAYHDHNERQMLAEVMERLRRGSAVALISDAGTPLISDPGYHLVRAAHQNGVPVSPIPGPCAAIGALSVSGLSGNRFAFHGYPPKRASARRRFFAELREEMLTLVFLEAPHRIRGSLQDMCAAFGPERIGCVAKELTKIHETVRMAPLQALLDWLCGDELACKGEFVVVVAGAEHVEQSGIEAERCLRLLLPHLPLKQAAAIAAEITGRGKRDLYRLGLRLQVEP